VYAKFKYCYKLSIVYYAMFYIFLLSKQTKQVLNHKWLKLWTNQNTKLNQIKNNIHNPGLKRKEETILNRLQIGHTFITHRYLMEKMILPYVKCLEWTSQSKISSPNAKNRKTRGKNTTYHSKSEKRLDLTLNQSWSSYNL